MLGREIMAKDVRTRLMRLEYISLTYGSLLIRGGQGDGELGSRQEAREK